MNILILTNPTDIVHHWPQLRAGFEWLQGKTKFPFKQERTLQLLSVLAAQKGKSYIALALNASDELESFIVAFDATPVFDEDNRVFQIYALMHKPANIKLTRQLINNFELWAVSQGVTRYYLATHKYGKSSISLFSRLGFRRDSLILTKEI